MASPSTDECCSPPAMIAQSPGGAYERLDLEENSRLRNWKQGESLGRGAYGEVYKAMVSGRFMAVKKIPLDLSLNPSAAEKEINILLVEINTLKRLKHPRIVRYHGCIHQHGEDDPALLIFLEFMPSGSIKAVLNKFGPYGIGLVRKYTRQILEGLEFLHGEKIVHRDVKGANILIDAEGDAKLADFGACKEMEALQSTCTGGLKSIHGSVYWMAPEVMKYKAGRRSDIWSLGCTVIEMINADAPWANLREEKLSVTATLKRIVEGDDAPPLPEKMPSDCRSFLERVLVRDHTKRPYADYLLKHRFVAAAQDGATPARRHGPGASPAAKATEAWGSSPNSAPAPA
uniref:Protein kinase domain-containing protein n=1 Tax=Zooxanthella nutricula TaxID=1333877 RepID=A0A7S2Q8Z8_9DINO